MDKVYAFTNENVNSYDKLYDFKGAKVLSVLGSGDQYFVSLLNGASAIEVFDINKLAWDYFVIKFYGIMTLSYEEFIDFFINKRMNDVETYKRLREYFPDRIRKQFDSFYARGIDLGNMLLFSLISEQVIANQDERIIPYFNPEKYYQLQTLLSKVELPTVYFENLQNLPQKLLGEHYDIILTSNIFMWNSFEHQKSPVLMYKNLLEQFDYSNIQAYYYWGSDPNSLLEFETNGFIVEPVQSVNGLSGKKDLVVSLQKK